MGLITSVVREYLDAYCAIMVDNVLSAQGLSFMHSMEEYNLRMTAMKYAQQSDQEIKSALKWDDAVMNVNYTERAQAAAQKIAQYETALSTAQNSYQKKLIKIDIDKTVADFETACGFVELQNYTQQQYRTLKERAALLDHIARQPSVFLDPERALEQQRQLRKLSQKSTDTVQLITRLIKTPTLPSLRENHETQSSAPAANISPGTVLQTQTTSSTHVEDKKLLLI